MSRHIRFVVILLTILLFLSCSSSVAPLSAGPPTAPSIDVFFSPRGGATEAIVQELARAKREVLVQAYSFTSAPIAKALVDAHKRGVKVTVVLDKSQRSEKYSSATFLNNAGIPTYIDAKHAIAHNKIMIIDQATIITGSFNFTNAAEEKNAENLLVIKGDPGLVKKYLANFEEHIGHSERYEGRN
jgi:phosphatidylserine/phosphatidylglycerophosphate/cardiolipin synthase-like enzyme